MDWPPSFLVESFYRLKKAEQKEEKTSATTKNLFSGTSKGSNHSVLVYFGYPPVFLFASYPYYLSPPQLQLTDSLIAILALKEKNQMEREEREDQARKPNRAMSMSYASTSFCLAEVKLQSSPVQKNLEAYIQWHI